MSKQSVAKWNRYLGWVTVPVLIASLITAYGMPDLDPGSALNITVQSLIGILPLIHFCMSLYVFGIPRFSKNERTIHIYIGYATLLAILISQSLFGTGMLFVVANVIMYLFIVAHLVMGVRSAMARRNKGSDQMIPLHRGQKG